MKFTKGIWELADGVTPVIPSQVFEVVRDERALTVYAPQNAPVHRGSLLGTPVLTVRYSSPLPDVIRVQVTHFDGTVADPPSIPLADDMPPVTMRDETGYAELQSGSFAARIYKDAPWRVDFLVGDTLVTRSEAKGLAYLKCANGAVYLREQLSLQLGEYVYGLGERFAALVKNGQSIDMWNEDPGTSSDLAYKNVPFYLTNKGYGVFVNSSGPVSFEVASERVSRVQFSQPGETLDYFVIYGPTPLEVLDKYTALTGRPALPPAWSFGLWLTTSFTTSYDEATVNGFVQGMADRQLPLHVFHFDCFWMKAFHWCDLLWDPATFPDPRGMLQRLKARGLKICVWINPYIAQQSIMFTEGKEHGYLLRKQNGDIYQTDSWQPGMGLVDFSNPAAVRWYGDKLRALTVMGVDCFKTDFGERIPTDVIYHNGADPMLMHNYYTYLYNQTVFDVLHAERGESDAVLFARSASIGCQKYPVHWGGDCNASYDSMAESLRGGLSLCASGFGFWSHDISGFEHTATPSLYKRWVAFGLLSSHSRLHGNSSYRVPWNFDDEASDVLRHFTHLKCQLMPYLYEAACAAATHGAPLMRAMALEFPTDPACAYLDRQYMLGPSLLVAPVFSDQGPVEYYLPAGRWTDFFTGEVREGGRWFRDETPDFFHLPLWVRENTVLPWGADMTKPDYDYTEGLTLRCYTLVDGCRITVRIPDMQGGQAALFLVTRQDDQITVTRAAGSAPWSVQLMGVAAIAGATGGVVEILAEGIGIHVDRQTNEVLVLGSSDLFERLLLVRHVGLV